MYKTSIGALADAGALSFGDGYRTKRSEHGVPGYRILRVADVHDGRIELDGPDFVGEKYARAIGPKLSQAGDVLLTTKGTVGRVAIYPDSAEQVVYSPQLCYFRVNGEGPLDARYLSYWFKSDAFKWQASHRANNTDMAAYLNLRDISTLQVELPSLHEQRAIAEVLGALDDKIAANDRCARVADEIAGALTEKAFSGECVALADIATVTMGSSPPGSSYNEEARGVPFFQGVRDFGFRFPHQRVWTDQPVRLASAKDTLLSVRAPVGRTNMAQDEVCIGRGLAAVQTRDGRSMTLFHQVRAAHAAWAPYEAEGTVFGSISRTQLEHIAIPVVRAEEAAQVESRLSELEDLIASLLREKTALATTRDQLLAMLMSGRVRIEDKPALGEGL